ncbi:hypothetical protein JOD55_001571 [Arcanobacterium pluranimalium]|uniref:hypothetical protein n=1 Tax=Arcanobacterium pluranimalium TaxID=108028 RepID=UPI0019599D91|nr:hypothetical protein [Arcanobacterium pluranimalium]MBM7825744.1 hypothetical protein [Arcanobacterium pluranimalium]
MNEKEFPREPDGEKAAWSWEGERFTASYERRLETIFEAVRACGWEPVIGHQGTEDGEAVLASRGGEESDLTYLFQIENPAVQDEVDAAIADGSLETYIRYLLSE